MESALNLRRGVAVINQSVSMFTAEAGIYKMINCKGEVLYVGKAKNLAKRVLQYTQIARLPNRLRLMVSLLHKIEVIITKSEEEALFLEAELIKGLQPRFNIALKDDKSFPYIAISNNHPFPRIFKYRGHKNPKVLYFGPFTNVAVLEDVIVMLQKIFQIRSCTDRFFAHRQRACLLYQIARCSAPCVKKIDAQQYMEALKQTKKVLSGKVHTIRDETIAKMEMASNSLDFEKAAEYRDTVRLLSYLDTQNLYNFKAEDELDIFAFHSSQMVCCVQIFSIRAYQHIGNSTFFLESVAEESEIMPSFLMEYYETNAKPKKIALCTNQNAIISVLKRVLEIDVMPIKNNDANYKLYSIAKKNAEVALQQHLKNEVVQYEILEGIKQIFSLRKVPSRMEIYDNSHIQGKNPVGCMVVHDGRTFLKGEYRVFKMSRKINESDDYAMMREMLQRRFKNLSHDNYPDLVVIDGGRGHLGVALGVLDALAISDIAVVAIAKGERRNAGEETVFTDNGVVIDFAKDDKRLHFLQRLRDEAHRFAINTHRKLRTKSTLKTLTTNIPGIGKKREQLLLSVFGSYEKIKAARLEELEKIPAIGKKIAAIIYNYLHYTKLS